MHLGHMITRQKAVTSAGDWVLLPGGIPGDDIPVVKGSALKALEKFSRLSHRVARPQD